MRLRSFTKILLPFIGLLVVGCTTYKGYDKLEVQPEEVTVIRVSYWQGYYLFGGSHMYFTSFDGAPTAQPMSGERANRIEMAPGKHTVGFKYEYHMWCGQFGCGVDEEYNLTLSFDAEPGHKYELDGERGGGNFWAWITDKSTGQVVAGEMPPE